MENLHNFTVFVKDEMVNVFKSCIDEGNEPYFEVYHITDFLSKDDAHMTPGMFLCRHVQSNYKSLVNAPDGITYFADLDKPYLTWDTMTSRNCSKPRIFYIKLTTHKKRSKKRFPVCLLRIYQQWKPRCIVFYLVTLRTKAPIALQKTIWTSKTSSII